MPISVKLGELKVSTLEEYLNPNPCLTDGSLSIRMLLGPATKQAHRGLTLLELIWRLAKGCRNPGLHQLVL